MTREELIEFAMWLDEGTDYFGKSYIEVKTDEWLGIKAKNIVAKPVLCGNSEQLLCCCDNPNGFKEMEQGREFCSNCKKPY